MATNLSNTNHEVSTHYQRSTNFSDKELIIFDFDGTIADTQEAAYSTYLILAAQYNIKPVSYRELSATKSLSLRQRFKQLGVPMVRLPKLLAESHTAFTHFIQQTHPFIGMKEILSKLSQTKNLVIVSSNSKQNIQTFIDQHDFHFFEAIYGNASLFGKEALISKVIRKHHIGVDQALYIGDESRDAHACERIGLEMIGVSWGYEDRSLLLLTNCLDVVDTTSQLKQLFFPTN